MKKFVMVLAVVLITVSSFAQKNKTPEAKAEMRAKKMQTALSLDDETYQKVYEIQLTRIQKEEILKKNSGDDAEAFKAGKRDISKATTTQLNELLGKEKMAEWRKYMKDNKKKKKE